MDKEEKFRALFFAICHKSFLEAMKAMLGDLDLKVPKLASGLPSIEEVDVIWEIKVQEPVQASCELFDLYGRHLMVIREDNTVPSECAAEVREKAETYQNNAQYYRG